MMNLTLVGEALLNAPDAVAGFEVVRQVYLPSVLFILFAVVFLQFLLAFLVLKRGFDKFFVIFIIPWLIGAVMFIFTFVIPAIPKWLGMLPFFS